jgi:hypothetical protein
MAIAFSRIREECGIAPNLPSYRKEKINVQKVGEADSGNYCYLLLSGIQRRSDSGTSVFGKF